MFIGRGTHGLKVKKLQYRLGIDVDGIFGSGTESHVKQWQEDNGLEVTGEMHDRDWKKMFGCSIIDWTPIGIVVHSMSEYIEFQGNIMRAMDFLKEIDLSVHAFIRPDGMIQSMKFTNKKAHHAGKSEHNGLVGLNEYFLGYEILVEGNNSYSEFLRKIKEEDCYTEKQFDSAVMLTRTWMEEYKIPMEDVVRHSDVSGRSVRPNDPKHDPGNSFDWQKFQTQIQ